MKIGNITELLFSKLKAIMIISTIFSCGYGGAVMRRGLKHLMGSKTAIGSSKGYSSTTALWAKAPALSYRYVCDTEDAIESFGGLISQHLEKGDILLLRGYKVLVLL
jgi:hypothetical protein